MSHSASPYVTVRRKWCVRRQCAHTQVQSPFSPSSTAGGKVSRNAYAVHNVNISDDEDDKQQFARTRQTAASPGRTKFLDDSPAPLTYPKVHTLRNRQSVDRYNATFSPSQRRPTSAFIPPTATVIDSASTSQPTKTKGCVFG
jgi:hypothetical protein